MSNRFRLTQADLANYEDLDEISDQIDEEEEAHIRRKQFKQKELGGDRHQKHKHDRGTQD